MASFFDDPLLIRTLPCLLIAVLLCLPGFLHGTLIGSAGAEVYGHAWLHQLAISSWPLLPRVEDWALCGDRPVIDPISTWIFAGLGHWIGGVLSWNLRILLGLWLVGIGGGRFVEAFSGNSRSFLLGSLAMVAAPIFLGSLTSGLTEDVFWGMVLLGWADLLEGRLLRGTLWLGGSAFCGLYLGWMGGMGALLLGLWSLNQNRAAWKSWAGAGILLLALGGLAAWPHAGRLSQSDPTHPFLPQPEPFWMLNPWHGVDLASFLAPGKPLLNGALLREHPSYLGVLLLGLAFYGGWHPLWILWMLLLAVSLGPFLCWKGIPLGMENPLLPLFQTLPFASHWHHYGRVLLAGQTLLTGLASRGFLKISYKIPTIKHWLPLMVVFELLFLSPARFPLPETAVSSPDIYEHLDLLPEGSVLVLGAAGPGIHPQKVFFDQSAHHRKLLHDPDLPRPLKKIPSQTVVVVLGTSEDPLIQETERRLGPAQVQTTDGEAWFIP